MKVNYFTLITVQKSDYSFPKIEIDIACKNIANFLYDHFNPEKDIVANDVLCNVVKDFLGWIKNCNSYNEERMSRFIIVKRNLLVNIRDENKLLKILKDSFFACTNKEDVDHLRGFTVEYFARLCYRRSKENLNIKATLYNGKALVLNRVDKIKIKTPTGDTKQSIDIIFISVDELECVEVKVAPKSFQLGNVLLFHEIYNKFANYDNKPRLIFYSFGEANDIKARIMDICQEKECLKLDSAVNNIEIKVNFELL